MKIPSLANISKGWRTKYNIKKSQQRSIILILENPLKDLDLPFYTIKLTRISQRTLDEDNLVAAFKYIIDQISSIINPGLTHGRADSVGNIKFEYSQKKGKPQTLRVEVF